MRKFIRQIFLFILFIGFLQFIIISIVLFLNKQLLKNCLVEENTKSVIVGDSHTMWSIDGDQIDNLENISLNAEGYIYTFRKLKHLFKTSPHVETIFLGVSYHNFSGYYDMYIDGSVFKYFISRYLGILTLKDILKIYIKSPQAYVPFSVSIIKDGINSFIAKECLLYGSFPSDRMYETFDSSIVFERIYSQYYEQNKVIQHSKSNNFHLNKIIALCKENNKKVIVLNSPLSNYYRENIPDSYIHEYDHFLINNNLESVDFKGMDIPDSCFLPDGDHVNYYGAMIATNKFKLYYENFFK